MRRRPGGQDIVDKQDPQALEICGTANAEGFREVQFTFSWSERGLARSATPFHKYMTPHRYQQQATPDLSHRCRRKLGLNNPITPMVRDRHHAIELQGLDLCPSLLPDQLHQRRPEASIAMPLCRENRCAETILIGPASKDTLKSKLLPATQATPRCCFQMRPDRRPTTKTDRALCQSESAETRSTQW